MSVQHLHTAVPLYKNRSVTHTYSHCLSSSRATGTLFFVFTSVYFCSSSPILIPLCLLMSKCVLSCCLRLSYPSICLCSSLLCFAFILPPSVSDSASPPHRPPYFSSSYFLSLGPVYIFPTVRQFMEMSCQHLSGTPSSVEGELLLFLLSLSLLLSFPQRGGRPPLFVSFQSVLRGGGWEGARRK